MRCDFKGGHGVRCGAALDLRTDHLGRVVVTCPACARRKAGICRCCPRPVTGTVGRALYCDTHRVAAARQRCAHWYTRNLEHARALRRECSARLAAKRRGGPPRPRVELAVARGYARAAALTPARRSEIARIAVTARWARARAAA